MQLKKAAQLITGIKLGVLPILRRFENHLQIGQNALSWTQDIMSCLKGDREAATSPSDT